MYLFIKPLGIKFRRISNQFRIMINKKVGTKLEIFLLIFLIGFEHEQFLSGYKKSGIRFLAIHIT